MADTRGRPHNEEDNDDGYSSSGADARRTQSSGPTERTRLLSADDPTVHITPYSLAAVRSLRLIGVGLLVLSVVWWLLMFISIYVTIPGLHARGSGFTQVAYSFLAICALVVSLVFFANPSKGDRAVAAAIAAVVCFDFFLVVCASKTRRDEGWVGVACLLWAAVCAVWIVVTDKVVEWAKHEEEERILGYIQTRRTLNEWFQTFTSLCLLVLLLLSCFLLSLTLILRAHDATLPPPGDKVWIAQHTYQVHVRCYGDANDLPTVLVEGGENPVQVGMAWIDSMQAKGEVGRVCYWDRPGFGWSDNAPSPMSAGNAADALSEALVEINEKPAAGWVLVSHGIGGIYSRIFASRHADDVKGLLLIDTLHEDLLPRVGSAGNAFLLTLRGLASPFGIDRLFGWIFLHRTREDRTCGYSAWRGGRWTKARLQQSVTATTLTNAEMRAARVILPREVPIAVVASGKRVEKDDAWASAQRELSKLSSKSLGLDVISGAPHEVWRDPDGRDILETRLRALVKG